MVCETGLILACGVLMDSVEKAQDLLQLDKINLSIHDHEILHDVSLQLAAGQTLGIIGESGSGKSMTALSIMQLLPQGSLLSGNIRFMGQSLDRLSETRLCELRGSEIGMIFQEPMTALNPVKTIGAQVSESIRLHRLLSRQEADELTAQTLARVGLPNTQFPLSRYPHELSGGQRQRVVIAIAIACKPRLLIADEPTTALDVTTQAGILDLLKSLQADEDLALLLITHDLAVVSNMADDVVVMRQGRVVEQGDLTAVFSAPSHDYTRLLFEASALTGVARAAKPAHESSLSANTRLESLDSPAAEYESGGSSSDVVRLAPDAAVNTPLLRVKNLVCEYPLKRAGLFRKATWFRAVDDVSFEIQRGQSLGLVGESGCGKSTLTRALLGLMKLGGGSIELNGESVSTAQEVSRAARREMQVVFQDPYGSFNPRHTVRRLVSEPLFLLEQPLSSAESDARVHAVMDSVGMLASDSDKYIHEFSGGQRQRIAIARALIVEPSLIILDEAVSALDVSVRAQVLQLLDTLAAEQGLAYLFISHDLSVVQRVTDQVLVMRHGKIVEQGATASVFAEPQHEYSAQLVAAAPRLQLS